MSSFPRIPALDRYLLRAIPAVRRMVIAAIDALRAGISESESRQAIDSRSTAPIFAAEGWLAFEAHLAEIYAPGGPIARLVENVTRATMQEPLLRTIELNLEPIRRSSALFLESEGGAMITRITEETRAAVRSLLIHAATGPLDDAAAAREIIRIRGFGLNRQLTAQHRKYVETLVDRWNAGELSRAEVHRLSDLRFRKLQRSRAKMIARTEANSAGNEARRVLWNEAANQGALDRDRYVIRWITRNLGVCPRCQALANKIAEIDGVFVSDPVASGRYAGQVIRIARPTVHPICYCALRLERRSDNLEAAA